MQGVGRLVRYGFLPIITMTRTWEDHEDGDVLDAFRQVLADAGLHPSATEDSPAPEDRCRGRADGWLHRARTNHAGHDGRLRPVATHLLTQPRS